MLRRLAISFAGVAAAAVAFAGCSSGGTNTTISVGPSFAPQSLYVSNSTQNAIGIYPLGSSSSGPSYQIGGSNTNLAGPQYLTFDSKSNLFVTNWLPSSKFGTLMEYKALATGDVLPYNSYSVPNHAQPRGIADFQTTLFGQTTKQDVLAMTVVDPSQPLAFSSQLQLTTEFLGGPYQTIAGPATGLNVPSGVAVDKSNNIYVTNLQGASVEEFTIPTPSPTPSPTATPSPTPSPTATPTGATPSPSPTPIPTATPVNIAPTATIAGAASGVGQPTGIAIDVSGNIYVSDQASSVCSPACPAILIFPAGSNGAVKPTFIAGAATNLYAPTDVKVDTSGKIYVADSTKSGTGVVYVFAAGSTGNVAPSATYTSPGTAVGLGLSP